jgi:hypothetical protein
LHASKLKKPLPLLLQEQVSSQRVTVLFSNHHLHLLKKDNNKGKQKKNREKKSRLKNRPG